MSNCVPTGLAESLTLLPNPLENTSTALVAPTKATPELAPLSGMKSASICFGALLRNNMFYGQEDVESIICMHGGMDSNGTTGLHKIEEADAPASPLGGCLTGQTRLEYLNHLQLYKFCEANISR